MQGKRHPILRAIGASMCTVALVLLSPTVSHAKYSQHPCQPGAYCRDTHPQHHERFRVPEPSADVLLLLGLGVTSLVSYGVQRRKRGA
jgi:PEP-CTERM motif